MSLIKRVINSFRKLFQISKKKVRKKTKSKKIRNSFVKKKKLVKKPSVISSKINKNKTKSLSKEVRKVKITKQPVSKVEPMDEGKFIGNITHFFQRIQVAVVELKEGPLKVGERILIKGQHTNFTQEIKSMQIESVDVKTAKKGQMIGLKVLKPSQVGDKLFKVKK